MKSKFHEIVLVEKQPKPLQRQRKKANERSQGRYFRVFFPTVNDLPDGRGGVRGVLRKNLIRGKKSERSKRSESTGVKAISRGSLVMCLFCGKLLRYKSII